MGLGRRQGVVKGPKVGFVNINGIRTKVDKIKEVMREQDLDVLVLVETWLKVGDNAALRPTVVDIRKDVRPGMTRGNGGIVVVAKPGIKVRVEEIDKEKNWVGLRVGESKVVCAYYPPGENEDKVKQFFVQMEGMCDKEGDKGCVVVGDFNGRVKEMSGDRILCPRGRWMKTFIESSSLCVRKPEEGKWTSYTQNGRGITDLVIVPRAVDPVDKFVVMESQSVGGSDHRLLTLQLDEDVEAIKEASTRWNLSKLAQEEVRVQFDRVFREGMRDTMADLDDSKRKVKGWVQSKQLVSIEEREEIVENLWKGIKDTINSALENSCGKASGNMYTNQDFETEEMARMKQEVEEAERRAQEAIDSNMRREVRKARWREYGSLKTRWNRRVLRRRTVVFRKTIDLLEDPAQRGTFMKIVNGMKKRDARTKSGLAAEDMPEHEAHFTTTFGAQPEGDLEEIDEQLLDETDNRADMIVKKHQGLKVETVKQMIKELARGKAAGVDGLPGEVWMLSNDKMEKILRELFILCEQLAVIPMDWRTCLVVLAYKKKGDIKNVGNYRPISLTCVVRRMFEKVIKTRYEKKIEKRLVKNQGGFRRKRSTYDQIVRLNEMLANSKQAVITFMDIATAYDCVDRRILWTVLRKKYKLKGDCIRVLRALFDDNVSVLLVDGVLSSEIANVRGLLQGSSLSPGLFNAYIDGLSVELSAMEGGLRSKGEYQNNLLFADDTSLLADTEEMSQALLDVCEGWAKRYGIKFKPSKCKAIVKGIEEVRLVMYGDEVEIVKEHEFLGLVFSKEGIEWEKSMEPRLEAARQRIHWMAKKGMNAFGWRVPMSIAIVKGFIRPMWEYGMAVEILPNKVIDKIQKVQNMALRKVLSTGKGTSIAAMHVMCKLEYVDMRNQQLNMQYFREVFNGEKSKHPIGRVVRKAGKKWKSLTARSSIKKFIERNKWGDRILKGEWPEKEEVEKLNCQKWRKERKDSKVSLGIPREVAGKGDPLLQVVGLSRRECYNLWQWKLGACGGSWRRCHNCNLSLSRDHFLECGGAVSRLKEMLREKGNRRIRWPGQVQRLNWLLNRDDITLQQYKEIAGLVEKCQGTTRGWSTTEEEYDDDENPDEALNKKLAKMREGMRVKRKKVPAIPRPRNAGGRQLQRRDGNGVWAQHGGAVN